MTAHLYPTCAACLAPLDSARHDAQCVAPLVVLCGESLSTVGESRCAETDSEGENGYDGGTTKDGPAGARTPVTPGLDDPRSRRA